MKTFHNKGPGLWTGSFRICRTKESQDAVKKVENLLKKIKNGINIMIKDSDIQTEDVTYMDVSRQGRNYKEVDKTDLTPRRIILWQ